MIGCAGIEHMALRVPNSQRTVKDYWTSQDKSRINSTSVSICMVWGNMSYACSRAA